MKTAFHLKIARQLVFFLAAAQLVKTTLMVSMGINERKYLWLFCLFAAIHIFVFSAAFPFFNIVDEDAHFDLVMKYRHGHLPVGLETVCRESAQYMVLYGTPEYLYAPGELAGGNFPPPEWTRPTNEISVKSFGYKVGVRMGTNHENSQAPLYYVLAAIWLDAGKLCGVHAGSLLLWLRLLNIFWVMTLIWLAHLTIRSIFPESCFLRLAVPALLAFIPQTAFYSINNDVLSPLCCGAVFLGLVWLLRPDTPDTPDVRWGVAMGLLLAAAYLTKLSNLPIIAVSAAALILKAWRMHKAGKLRIGLPFLACLILCAGLPIGAWRIWVKLTFGDTTGTMIKMHLLGWTYKPFREWWHHPIFTPQGCETFLSKLVASFWQGEFLWHSQPLASPAVDIIYLILSVSFVGMALFVVLRRGVSLSASQRQALWLSFAFLVASVGFLAGLSIIYDFHDCFYPSVEHPFFTSGRLMLGALIPFLLLFTFGMDCVLSKFSDAAKYVILVCMILFMLISEIVIDWPVFSSQYNWFHM